MSGGCPGIVNQAFLESALRFVDCQAQTIGASGYQVLAAPGSTVSMLITGVLTLFVALFGYRLLLGDTPTLRGWVLAIVKVGVVLALATSWAAYRTLAYDIAFNGPSQLLADIGTPAGVPGADGAMASRLQQVDDALLTLGRLGTGPADMTTRVREVEGQNMIVPELSPEPPTIVGTSGLGTARLVYLTSTIAAFASARLVAGLLLALGPFFILFLLFDATRGIFLGWLRALIAAAIGATAVLVLLGVELALLEPWLATLIAQRQAQLPLGGAPTELLVVALVFALALIAGLGAAARIAGGLILPAAWSQSMREAFAAVQSTSTRELAAQTSARSRVPSEEHSRAAAVAEAVVNLQRREANASASSAPSRAAMIISPASARRNSDNVATTPLGRTATRRTRTRTSASAGRRDNRQ
jgi:type IV secretion system protein VirB6